MEKRGLQMLPSAWGGIHEWEQPSALSHTHMHTHKHVCMHAHKHKHTDTDYTNMKTSLVTKCFSRIQHSEHIRQYFFSV